jgi:hypothetical protein
MTDPERISKRSTGLAAQLLQASAEEQPNDIGVQQTLAALGVSGAVLTTTSTVSAAAAGTAKATSAIGASAGGGGLAAGAVGGTAKAVTATLLVKWIGIGVVGGVGLAGAAAVATRPAPAPHVASHAVVSAAPVVAAAAEPPAAPHSSLVAVEPAPEAATPVVIAAPHVSVTEPIATAPMLEVGAPLAAEVAYVDRARALLAAGLADQGLALLQTYEREFPEARLLPEVLFLRLETCDRLGRTSEARSAAQRLLNGFPRSPHAARARKVLAQ